MTSAWRTAYGAAGYALIIWTVSVFTFETRACGIGAGVFVAGISLAIGMPVCGACGLVFAALVPNVRERFKPGLKTRMLATVAPLGLALAVWVATSGAHEPCRLL